MEGLGPNNSSLLERVGKAMVITLDWLTMDRQERGQLRKASAIKHAMKHRKPPKPLAPVEPTGLTGLPYVSKGERLWKWIGEDLPSKNIVHGEELGTKRIREAGFRLPKLVKKGKKLK